MQELRQSTAINVMLGVFVDDTTGKDTEEALTLAQADLQLSKNGAAAVQKTDATSATHRYGGNYSVPLNATDTDTLGCLELMCKESGALPVKKSFMVVTQNYWDSKHGTDKLQVDVTQLLGTAWLTPGTAGIPDVNTKQIGGTVQTGRDIGTSVLLSSGSGTGQLDITSGVVKSNLAQILGTALTETAGYIAAGFKKLFNVATPLLVASEAMRGTDSAALNTGVQLSAQGKLDVNAECDTALSNYGANTTVPDAAGVAATPAEVATALTNIHLDHLFAVDYDPASKPGTATALLNELIESDGGVSRYTANALEQASGSGLSAQETRDAMKLAPTGGAPAAGSVDLHLDDILTDTGTTLETHLMDIKGGTFSGATDSLEAIRDRGDDAWVTGGGGSISDILNVQPLIPNAIDLANIATVRIGLGLTNMLDDLPSTAEITPGTITIDRKAVGGTSWSNVINAAACSELAGLIYYDEVFDSGAGYMAGDAIRITFKSQKITVSANDYEITGTDGWAFHTYIREAMRGTDSAALALVCTEGRLAELDAANLPADMDAALADTNELQINQGNWVTAITVALSAQGKLDVNAECDMALTDYGANTVVPDAAGVAPTASEIKTEMEGAGTKLALVLEDTNELQTNQSNWVTATGFSVPNEYDTVIAALQTDLDDSTQYKADVSSLALEATLAAMKGSTFNETTDSLEAIRDRGDDAWITGGGGSAPTVGEIRTEMEGAGTKLTLALEDTNELQANQGNWLTATGFSVPNEYDVVIMALQADLDNPNQYKADVSVLALENTVQNIKTKTDNLPASPAPANEYDLELVAIQADLDNPDQYKADISGLALETTSQLMKTDIEFLKHIEGGRWKIDTVTDQMIFYAENNITEVARFDLKDKDGNPVFEGAMERVRV